MGSAEVDVSVRDVPTHELDKGVDAAVGDQGLWGSFGRSAVDACLRQVAFACHLADHALQVSQPKPLPKIGDGRPAEPRPRAALRRRLRARPPTPTVGTRPTALSSTAVKNVFLSPSPSLEREGECEYF